MTESVLLMLHVRLWAGRHPEEKMMLKAKTARRREGRCFWCVAVILPMTAWALSVQAEGWEVS